MQIGDVRQEIARRRENEETYEEIAKYFDIQKSMVKYIETHLDYKPSSYISKKLGLEPSKKLECTRIRIAKKNAIAQYWGYKSWSDYETQTIKDFEKNFDFETGKWSNNL